MIFQALKMQASDSLQRFLFEHFAICGQLVHLDNTWRAILERRDYPPALRGTLGELTVAAALMSSTIKFPGRLTMQVQGKGPINLLVVECTGQRTLRATAQWTEDLENGSLSSMIGDGKLVITIDPEEGRERYQGIVSLEGNTTAEILENYFARSEQLETRLWLAADSNRAAGMLLQRLPVINEDNTDAWARAGHLGATLTRSELLELPAYEIIRRLYHEEDIRVFDSLPVSFRCSCSRDRVAAVLRMLGWDEIESVLEENGIVGVGCEFCNQHYEFDRIDSAQLFSAHAVPGMPRTRH